MLPVYINEVTEFGCVGKKVIVPGIKLIDLVNDCMCQGSPTDYLKQWRIKMLNQGEINDLKKLVNKKLDSEQHFIDVLNATFNALIKDPIKVDVQLRRVYNDTEGNTKTVW